MDNLVIEKLPEEQPNRTMDKELSGVMIVIIIGGGTLLFIVLFIFAKRQIMRFTIRSRRGPHVAVGHDAKKSLKRELERRLDCIQKIAYEPRLIWDDDSQYILKPDTRLPPYYYRMKAVDDIKVLEKEIGRQDGRIRHPRDSLRSFLLTTLAAPLNGNGQRDIQQFCDMYEHARHDPNEFGKDEYDSYYRLFMKLIDAARNLKSFSNSRKSSPSRTPVKKQTKMQSLLDPSRLRPPSMTSTGAGDPLSHNTRINITLGMQQSQTEQQQRNAIVDDNEILSISQYHDEPSVV